MRQETSDLLRPIAGHRDLGRRQPRRIFVSHVHDGEAVEVRSLDSTPLADRYSARRGTYRIISRIDDAEATGTVLMIRNLSDAYRL